MPEPSPITPLQHSIDPVSLAIGLLFYLYTAYAMMEIGRRLGDDGPAGRYWIPVYNLFLLARRARAIAGFILMLLGVLGYFACLSGLSKEPVERGFAIAAGVSVLVAVCGSVYLWGTIARKLGRNFWLYGLTVTFLGYLPVLALSWDKRRGEYTLYAAAYILVVLGVLVFANVLANRYDKFLDFTKNKQFSLSEQTAKIVKGLKQDVTFTYFGREDSFRGSRDLLDRYSDLSPRLHVRYMDPDKKPQPAKAAGYRPDSPVIVDSGARREGAKSVTEEEVTGALIRSLKTAERNVCFVSGFGEHSIDDSDHGGFSYLKQLLEHDNYKSRAVTLKPAATEAGKSFAVGQAVPAAAVEVPKDCTVLVAGGPQESYPPPVADAIRNFVENGGSAVIMLDTVVRLGRQEPAAENPDLVNVLAGWGVAAGKDLVLEGSPIGRVFGFGPEIPVVMQYETHQITQPLTRVMTAFPLARSLDIKGGGKATVDKLLQTSEDSVAIAALSDIRPDGTPDPNKVKRGPFTLAAAGTVSGAAKGRFVVAGTSEWAINSLVGSGRLGNGDLFMNSIDWLSQDLDLISIRPKTTDDQPFSITTPRLATLFYLTWFVFPLGVVGFGLATWWKRR
ncbi:MAG TPA: GldG family protein [Bryobacteraceae bacterium]|nr:GldG family protein [Bryobacteraceae bacterium]